MTATVASVPVPRTTSQDLATQAMFVMLALHLPLAVVMKQYPILATAHCILTVFIGVWLAASSFRLDRVAYAGAYIVGCDVLWRMTKAKAFWETGKYALLLVFALALLRRGNLKVPMLSLGYFLLLLPSAVLTIADPMIDDVRGQLSFNLSGPLSLAVAAWFFHSVKLDPAQWRKLLMLVLAPITAVWFQCVFHIVNVEEITFTNGSNANLSGGFGANQVSALLGFGAVIAILLATDPRSPRLTPVSRLILFGIVIALLAQSALTFSRGGVYNFAAAMLAATPFLARDSRARNKILLIGAGILLIGYFVIYPALDTFTGGRLGTRYSKADLTHRDILMRNDLDLWSKNPVLGVGPGASSVRRARPELGERVAAHTEFTRLLAEHGVLGVVALLLLVASGYKAIRNGSTPYERAVITALFIWACAFMCSAAMRIAAVSFAIGLCQVTFLQEPQRESSPARRTNPLRLSHPPPIRRPRSSSESAPHA
jgi:hypothetical protein